MAQENVSSEPMRLERNGRLRTRASLEIVFVVFCVLVTEWAVIPIFGRSKKIGMIPVAVVLAFALLSHRSRGENAQDLGFGGRGFVPAFRVLLLWMVPASAFLFALGWKLGTLHSKLPESLSALALSQLWLFLWALMQQYALQAVVNRRAQEIWGNGARSIVIVAILFAGLHMPNFWLAAATFLGGLLWAAVYQKSPNLYALALSHSLMTTVLSSTVSSSLLHGLRVGYHYF